MSAFEGSESHRTLTQSMMMRTMRSAYYEQTDFLPAGEHSTRLKVENVKALLEVETQIPLQQQQLLYQGNELVNNQNLQVVGIVEGDLLILLHTPSRSGNSHSNELSLNHDGSAANPMAFLKHLKRDPQAINHLLERNPELAEAVLGDNVEALQNFLRQQHSHRLSLQQRQQQELELLNADPFDVDAQRRIEEAIQQKNIDENWEAAVEHNPEAFARVVMLYVDMEVNGIPIKAFVDSGAQSTIISKACAERCGLLRLMDRRFRGIARGVGQSEIVGRIHVAPLKIGKNYYPCSFTVLDQPNLEFLFGLDMLRKHQCSIDLKDNVLRVGGEIAVPFLQEKDIPLHLHDEDAKVELQGGSTSAQAEPAGNRTMNTQSAPPSSFGGTSSSPLNSARNTNTASALELKVTRLVELGFDRASVIQALSLFNGNEEQAASYLFGG